MQQLPDWVDGYRALAVLVNFFRVNGLTDEAKRRLLQPSDEQTTLPGFTVFNWSRSGVRADEWCVPGRLPPLGEIVATYEAYVDSGLGRHPRPCRIARRAMSPRAAEVFFGPPRAALQWWVPAAQLVALASRKSGVKATWGQNWAELNASGFRLLVRADGCWSNSYDRMVTTSKMADDADIAELTVEPLVTAHPLARAVRSLGGHNAIQWAANSVIRAEQAGRIPTLRPVHLETRVRGTPSVATCADTLGAIDALREALDGGQKCSVMYGIAVPTLMSSAEFRSLFANRSRSDERRLSPRLAARIHEYLDLREACH